MSAQIRLQKHHLSDLRVIRDIDARLLRQAIDKLRSLSSAPIHPQELHRKLTDVFPPQVEGSEALMRQLLSLHGLVRQMNLSPNEVFEGLRLGLQPSESRWSKEEFEKWGAIEPLFRELFELDVIGLSAKALDLSYEHSELLRRARILTDIRPVFNREATEIRGAVISHTLLIRYDDIEGDHVLSLAIDEKDIHSIIDQCERAIRKSETARKHLTEKSGISALVPGKDDNE